MPDKNTQHLFNPDYWIHFWRIRSERALDAMFEVVGLMLAYVILRTILYRLIDEVMTHLSSHEARIGITEARGARLNTLQGLCKGAIGYVLFFVFGVLILKALGFEIMPFITTAGVIGVAFGFGAQKLVKDVISGFFIIIDNLFVIGDTVAIGTTTGIVQEMGMRVTRLLDPTGRVVLISNGDIGTVTNLSRHPVDDFVEVTLAAMADTGQAEAVINTAGKALYEEAGHQLRAAPQYLGVSAFSANSITIRVAVVADPRAVLIEQMRVREALRKALAGASIGLA